MAESFLQDETLRWALGIAFGFPLLMVVFNELVLRLKRRNQAVANTLRIVRNMILPSLAVLLLLDKVIELPPEGILVRIAQTVFLLTALHGALALVNDVIFANADEESWQASVPKLMLDLVRLILVLIGGAIVLGVVWDVNLTGLATALGVGSIVIGLALQEPLGNVISGLLLMLERPIRLGDWITVDGVTGRVDEINWRSVHIATFTRELRIIPNGTLHKGTFSNLSRPTPDRTDSLELQFSYDDPPNTVKEVLLGLIQQTAGVLDNPAPKVRTVEYADYAIKYRIVFTVACQEDMVAARDGFMTRVWYAARRHGLTIPYPIQTEIAVDSESIRSRGPTPAESLSALPRFGIKDPEMLEEISRRVTAASYARGERIAKEGQSLNGLYLILSGEVALSVRDRSGIDREIARIGRGEFFGESSLLSGSSNGLTITALDDLEVLVLDTLAAQRWMDRMPRLARELGSIIDVRRQAASMARKLVATPK